MDNESPISTAIATLFSGEMTEQGLAELRERFPKDIVHDMTDETQFKAGRKVRTELNKLTEAIKDRRLSVTGQIKTKADELTNEVELIYSSVVGPFKTQLGINKLAKEKEERELKKLLDGQRVEISNINNFVTECIGKTSQSISGVIEAVDLVDTSYFHKDIIHEAIKTKKRVAERLTELLTQALNEESLQSERNKIDIQKRLNTLSMIPVKLINQSSSKIKDKIDSLNKHVVSKDEFGESYQQAVDSVKTVISQLTSMHDQQIIIEDQAGSIESQEQQVIKTVDSAELSKVSSNKYVCTKSSMAETMAQSAPTLANAINEEVTISKYEYQQLLNDSEFLGCLMCAGIENWDGYSNAQTMMENNV